MQCNFPEFQPVPPIHRSVVLHTTVLLPHSFPAGFKMSQHYGEPAPAFLQMVELDNGKASQERLVKPAYYNHPTAKPIPIANPGALYVSPY